MSPVSLKRSSTTFCLNVLSLLLLYVPLLTSHLTRFHIMKFLIWKLSCPQYPLTKHSLLLFTHYNLRRLYYFYFVCTGHTGLLSVIQTHCSYSYLTATLQGSFYFLPSYFLANSALPQHLCMVSFFLPFRF